MTKTNDGGPAFPQSLAADGPFGGMTLRQWYAGQALNGMLAHSTRYKPLPEYPQNWHDAISQEAYEIADSMIAASEVTP